MWRVLSVTPEYEVAVVSGGDDPYGTDEVVDAIKDASGRVVEMLSCFTLDGHYIGNERRARFLCNDRGIAPELAIPEHEVCSIGFSERDQKWYGWSHRAIYGFGIGSVVKAGDCAASSGFTDAYLAEHPEADMSLPVGFTAKTLPDARRIAVAFAESVG